MKFGSAPLYPSLFVPPRGASYRRDGRVTEEVVVVGVVVVVVVVVVGLLVVVVVALVVVVAGRLVVGNSLPSGLELLSVSVLRKGNVL